MIRSKIMSQQGLISTLNMIYLYSYFFQKRFKLAYKDEQNMTKDIN